MNSPVRKIVCTGAYSQLVAITLPSGTETEEEAHGANDQVVFIVEGAGEAILNGQVEPAGEHDAIFIPAGTVHKFKNSGTADLKMFVTYSPAVTPDTDLRPRHRGRMNFYAIAQSSPVNAKSDTNVRDAFPGGIKWTSLKSPRVRNVLVATDFSPASEAALPYAFSIARHYGSTLTVAHIINPEIYRLMPPQTIEQILDDLREAAAARIQTLIRSTSGEDAQYEPAIAVGTVGDALVEMVQAKGIDLIVLGTHGRRGLRKLVLGSVTEEVLRMAPCPVLAVGPKAVDGAGAVQIRQIVYQMELHDDVVKAAEYAISIAKEYGAELTFLNVIEEPSMSGEERAWVNIAAQHWFGDKVAPNLGLDKKPGLVQMFGDPAAAILQCAAEKDADLIVMNLRGAHPEITGQLPGIAHRVVAEASCPVLTVR